MSIKDLSQKLLDDMKTILEGGTVVVEDASNDKSDDGEGLDKADPKAAKKKFKDKKYFDFGISNEQQGRYLNRGLINQKENFGARAIVHQFFELNIDHAS